MPIIVVSLLFRCCFVVLSQKSLFCSSFMAIIVLSFYARHDSRCFFVEIIVVSFLFHCSFMTIAVLSWNFWKFVQNRHKFMAKEGDSLYFSKIIIAVLSIFFCPLIAALFDRGLSVKYIPVVIHLGLLQCVESLLKLSKPQKCYQ